MSNLYIVATPIGNLSDISLRATDVLGNVDLILCEDTRKTKVLLDHYNIKTKVLSYHQHSKFSKINQIIDMLKQGKNLALVSDAGTPGISDPGNKLIEQLVDDSIEELKIIPIPGPSAIAAAASISGFPMERFLFLGFSPVKKKRGKFFEEISQSAYPVIFYESPYRIMKTINELKKINPEFKIVICRELTKKFETVYRGFVKDAIDKIVKDEMRGEFTVIINK
ncbi:MAG: 16S rRNA (cytidine(1402)-2'-O)-methyltransferase [Patescibacteria group bacterium]